MEVIFNSPQLNAFGLYMGTFTQGHIQWTDLYPIKERLLDDFDNSNTDPSTGPAPVLMVDAGGGYGHQTALLKHFSPDLPGRLVVQDLPHMKGPDLPGIEFMPHDFTTPQPVKHARCYYLRFIIHDYDDEQDTIILKHLRDAMKPGYSRLLINERIIPERGASRFLTVGDINMMAVGGMERTEEQHRALLQAAGLTVTEVYRAGDKVSAGIIEAMREE